MIVMRFVVSSDTVIHHLISSAKRAESVVSISILYSQQQELIYYTLLF